MRTIARCTLLLAWMFTGSHAFAQNADGHDPLTPLPAPTSTPASTPTSTSTSTPTPTSTSTSTPTPTPTPTPTSTSTPTPTPTPVDLPPKPSLLPAATPRHEGFYLRILTGGIGYLSVSGDGPAGSASISGLASGGGLAIGGTIARGLALAGTIRSEMTTATFQGGPFDGAILVSRAGASTTNASTNATAAAVEIGLLADWYPNLAGGWHVGVSGGLGGTNVTNLANNGSLVGLGGSGSLFGGYDWWVGQSWSLGLMLLGSAATTATLNDGGRDSHYRMMPLSLTVQTSVLYF